MQVLVWLFAIMLSLVGPPPVVAGAPGSARPASARPASVQPASVQPARFVQAPGFPQTSGLVRLSGPVPPSVFVRVVAVAPVPAGEFRWPLDGPPHVARRFDPPPRPWLAGHRGVDLAATAGVPVRAAGGGTVHFAGSVAGRGVVSVTHPNGLRTTYEPLEPTVHAGQTVAPGDQIGTLAAGHAGCPAAACLHWGLRRGDEYLDPLALLGLGRVRLLPLAAPAQTAGGAAFGLRVLR
ncbi:M23 family metallopeptidase [Phytohabitans sp. ZYX-F-186]|uniref:M23 family metallopeptidase n=1 Tax=Phytohabitans maris TaxID=3071409 RepID=A0ABU0ZLI6_9ACTN|nr:M23 family metallopeptidase [Phytohabitans sp. ZYX-F-186]MDQ7907254.1 M23 family metallopeptidase [Phytohabitans sp. ZYX-F-186]